MDVGRFAYVRECKFFRDDPRTVRIRWYRALPDAKFFPGVHRFSQLSWYSRPWEATGAGETDDPPLKWSNGFTPPSATGRIPFGSLEEFRDGCKFDALNVTARDVWGIAIACGNQVSLVLIEGPSLFPVQTEAGDYVETEEGVPMSSVKVSALPVAGALDGTEQVMVDQGGVSKKATLARVATQDAADGLAYVGGGSLLSDPNISPNGAGILSLVELNASGPVIGSQLQQTPGASDEMPYFDGAGVLRTDPGITTDESGVLTAQELHAGNGFNGVGIFTTFTIVDGVILAAS